MKHLRKPFLILVIGIFIILVREYEWNQIINTPPEITGNAELIRIVDGDTLIVRLNGIDERVRIIGIDTPESVKPNSPVECFASETSDHMKQLLNNINSVRVETDPTQDTRDRYGRLLAHIFVGNVNIGNQMVYDGYAYEYTYREPYLYQREYRKAQRAARSAKNGLWAEETCSGKR
jgi:micrococcal nuclease